MLSYLSDIFNALEYKFVYLKSARRPVVSTDAEGEDKATSSTAASSSSARLFVDDDIDEAAAISLGYGDDDYLDHNCYYGEEDEEDEELCEKLCTFTETQKEFINQHWYHCHTCKMLDGVGVCNVCAQVCHRGHDVTYSKHGSFFCDCGASEDGSCRALVRRQPKAQQRQPAKRAKRSAKGGTKKSAAAAASAAFASSKDRKKLMRISKYWYSALFAQGKFLVVVIFMSQTNPSLLQTSSSGSCRTTTRPRAPSSPARSSPTTTSASASSTSTLRTSSTC